MLLDGYAYSIPSLLAPSIPFVQGHFAPLSSQKEDNVAPYVYLSTVTASSGCVAIDYKAAQTAKPFSGLREGDSTSWHIPARHLRFEPFS